MGRCVVCKGKICIPYYFIGTNGKHPNFVCNICKPKLVKIEVRQSIRDFDKAKLKKTKIRMPKCVLCPIFGSQDWFWPQYTNSKSIQYVCTHCCPKLPCVKLRTEIRLFDPKKLKKIKTQTKPKPRIYMELTTYPATIEFNLTLPPETKEKQGVVLAKYEKKIYLGNTWQTYPILDNRVYLKLGANHNYTCTLQDYNDFIVPALNFLKINEKKIFIVEPEESFAKKVLIK